ncbi:MAG: LytTR family DNA-binding domain-containing protein [Cyclobacteriaceae bacterium]|nr:LytTR family DNA-binding domain-containing protein [Cyclobacteriaceae bacterium]
MKVLIVEDEKLAGSKLINILSAIDASIEVVSIIDSVKNTAKWLAQNPSPDLIFMDIQLGDGICFEIFDIIEVPCPTILVTAFNEYAQEAFKVNSIDYLLKPVEKEEVESALGKYHLMKPVFDRAIALKRIKKAQKMLESGYKSRFMIKVGAHIVSVPIEEIAYFFSREKATFFKTFEGRSYLIDYSLEQVEEMVDPLLYFRINRKYMVAFKAISDIVTYSSSRLKINIPHMEDHEILISRHRVTSFKDWLDR